MSESTERWLILKFSATIGVRRVPISDADVRQALPLEVQIAETVQLDLGPHNWDGEDLAFATHELDVLVRRLEEAEARVNPTKIGVFAIAPISLLAGLGRRLGDQSRYEIRQLLREPFAGWSWRPDEVGAAEIVFPPIPAHQHGIKDVAVVLSLSQPVSNEEWRKTLPDLSPAVYNIKGDNLSYNIIQTRAQLRDFAIRYRDFMSAIKAAHGGGVRVHIFAGTPVSVSVELGRQLLQWAFSSVKVYDWQGDHYGRCLELAPRSVASAPVDPAGVYVEVSGSGVVGRHARRGPGWDSPEVQVHGEPFEISASAITWGDWRMCRTSGHGTDLYSPPMGADPALPATVSWLDALRFANACSRRDGRTPAFEFRDGGASVHLIAGDGYRLPLEHEWELAASAGRAGTAGPFADTGGSAVPARAGQPGDHGLYQALGNVWEWCLDPWEPRDYSALGLHVRLDSRAATLCGPDGAALLDLRLCEPTRPRVVRGGGWDIEEALVDIHTRCFAPSIGNHAIGFRLVRPRRAPASLVGTVPPTPPSPPATQGTIHMSTFNISGTNIQVNQHSTGFQDNRSAVTAPGLAQRLDELLAGVAEGQQGLRDLHARMAAVEGELATFSGGVGEVQAMLEPLWRRHVTEERRGAFERFVRSLPTQAPWLVISEVATRLLAG